ncbi:MAG: OmpA family protein [Calditrichaeota bacterium]|nr:OmpA family protein [Calditrichota bacterium]RQV92939.1 MAG: OmpA family protein [bacterium]RQW07986.1 MAG: OmpA family protein [Calditrichota bacterium]
MNNMRLFYLQLLALVFLMSGIQVFAQQNIESMINAVENEMSQLRQQNYDLLSPENFNKAQEEFQKARKDFDQRKDIRGIMEKLQKASRYLKVVNEVGKQGEILFADVLQAREDALVVQAPEYAPALFEEAEKKFLEASGRLEDGDLNGARNRTLKVEEAYRQAELRAIKESIIGNVRDLLNQAEEQNVKDNAPITLNLAKTLYDEVLVILNSNRYAKSNARETATEAAYQAKHAMYLASIIKKLKNDDKNWEKLIRDFEDRMDNIAAELGFKGNYANGFTETEKDIIIAIQTLKEENKTLKEDLAQLQDENQKLETKVQQYEKTVVTELQRKKEREEKLKKIEKMFTRDEARVLLSENQMIIRLYGLTFGVGSAVIAPDQFMLLTKVMRALREFPNKKYMITGHTDSQGNDAYNLNLSENRAEAVRAYLEANMNIPPQQFESIGYGESKPIASNDTPEGRRMNRRIDVIIDLESNIGDN